MLALRFRIILHVLRYQRMLTVHLLYYFDDWYGKSTTTALCNG